MSSMVWLRMSAKVAIRGLKRRLQPRRLLVFWSSRYPPLSSPEHCQNCLQSSSLRDNIATEFEYGEEVYKIRLTLLIFESLFNMTTASVRNSVGQDDTGYIRRERLEARLKAIFNVPIKVTVKQEIPSGYFGACSLS